MITRCVNDPERVFQGHGDALDELCAQLTRDLFAIAKFLLSTQLAFEGYHFEWY